MASILISLVLCEIGIRVYRHATRPAPPPPSAGVPPTTNTALQGPSKSLSFHLTTDLPFLYGMNPAWPGVNSHGLWDDEVSLEKPEGTLRILVLGDSVPFGPQVSSDKNFPNRIEQLLKTQIGPVEVINSGVQAYTAYNELQYYLTKGREFEPDIVMVAFCMNDVVNPRLHWGYFTERILDIPDQAIPNHEYDKKYILPKLRQRRAKREAEKKQEKSLLEHSALYNFVKVRTSNLFRQGDTSSPDDASETLQNEPNTPRRDVPADVPTFITAEDPKSIEVLLDRSSPEWQWLTSIYDQLYEAVRADQATFVIVIIPLAYQLDEGYPFFPQKQIAAYCEERSILCIDPLPAFKKYSKEDIFLLNSSGYNDIWHLTEFGHEICAEEILRGLENVIPFVHPGL